MTQVTIVGGFPPPVHGMAVINSCMARLLAQHASSLLVFDTSAGTLGRGLAYHGLRLRRYAAAAWGILTQGKRGGRLYLGLSGGFGQIYDLLIVALARTKGLNVAIHHHSYAYITRTSRLTRVLIAAASEQCVHVALSVDMATRLSEIYGIRRCRVISNAAFLDGEATSPPARPLRTLGFLSNISAEKGVFEFISLVRACNERGMAVKGMLAGPFADDRVKEEVLAAIAESGIEYVGAKYGEEKQRFFEQIDVLVFPTQYVNEAEPVTIHEAMKCSNPVIAIARGAIPEVIEPSGGRAISPDDDFVSNSFAVLQDWVNSPEQFAAARRKARESFERCRANASGDLRDLIRSFTSTTVSGGSM